LKLEDLEKEEIRERLRMIWTDPLALDPSRKSARVTRDVASKLAALAKSLEESGQTPETVATFLMRCLFTMFAEDIELIPRGKFTELLEGRRNKLTSFKPMLEALWQTMNTGGFSSILEEQVLRFNGGLFESCEALEVTKSQLELLIEAAHSDWREVEPAIFGTLLERALDPIERHKLGAHYTPRAYVERLVLPTVIEPLREEWKNVQAAAVLLAQAGRLEEASTEVQAFHRRLCEVRVLDPACGSGNFLYVTLEHLKRLEGEVINALDDFDARQTAFEIEGFTVDPHQLLGLEVNPRAAAIADLVLWIGYLQWHFRTRGDAKPREPVLRAFRNIENRDAVLTYDQAKIVTSPDGRSVTRWDGRTQKLNPVTGEEVPDESARVPIYAYINARRAQWPAADYVVGNPPFIGTRKIKTALGDEYVETLRKTYPEVPETCDYVMYWWHKAALAVKSGALKRFGLITTNSIVQSYSKGLIEDHLTAKDGISLLLAIPDHPWVESSDGAAVRVSMTVGISKSAFPGSATILRVVDESPENENAKLEKEIVDSINASLQRDIGQQNVQALLANREMCFQGVVPAGDGFKLEPEELLNLGFSPASTPSVIKKYLIGRDIVQRLQPKHIIDFFGISESEARDQWPQLYQRLLDRVHPERRLNKRAAYRDKWWIFAEPRPAMRRALKGLERFIITSCTAKHRIFIFADKPVLPDTTIYVVPSSDAFLLGILSSHIHAVWSLTVGGTLEDRPRYTSKETFAPFPFPECSSAQRGQIRALAEQLDAHRKRQQELHPDLTLTDMYNVLEKERSGVQLSSKERSTHERGLIAVLRQIHDELDVAVAAAYGWRASLSNEEILGKLIELNSIRAREEQAGVVRWLRPEYQKPAGVQATIDTGEDQAAPIAASRKTTKRVWPKALHEQASVLRSALSAQPGVVTAEQLAKDFFRARTEVVAGLLQTFVSLGLAREVETGRFTI
jgi:hypothetical protein